MSECKGEIFEMIDNALRLNGHTSGCTCIFNDPEGELCAHCTIREALRMSRACIVASVDRIDVIKAMMGKVHEEIERKLKTLLESSNKGV